MNAKSPQFRELASFLNTNYYNNIYKTHTHLNYKLKSAGTFFLVFLNHQQTGLVHINTHTNLYNVLLSQIT